VRKQRGSTSVRAATRAIVATVLAVAVWGCSSGPGSTPTGTALPAASTNPPSASPAPTAAAGASATSQPSVSGSPRPASGSTTLAGDPGLAGPLAISGIRCQLPAVAGQTIAIFGTTPNGVLVQVILADGSIAIRAYTGAGATATERNFGSSSLASFDAATGATFDTAVTPTPGPNPPGTIGAVTAIKGTIDCGGQRPGTSTLVLTGTGIDGTFGPSINPVRVQCDTGPTVQATGIVQVGGKATLALIAVRTGAFTLFTSASGQTHLYQASTGVTALTATGARLDGDAVEAAAAGGTSHTIHIAGELTCGVTGQF